MFASVRPFDGKIARNGWCDCQRALRLDAIVGTGRDERAARGDSQRQCVARDQAFDRPRRSLVLYLGALIEGGIFAGNTAPRRPHHGETNRQQRQRNEEQKLGGGG